MSYLEEDQSKRGCRVGWWCLSGWSCREEPAKELWGKDTHTHTHTHTLFLWKNLENSCTWLFAVSGVYSMPDLPAAAECNSSVTKLSPPFLTLRELREGHFLWRAVSCWFFSSFLAWDNLNLFTRAECSANCIAFGKDLSGWASDFHWGGKFSESSLFMSKFVSGLPICGLMCWHFLSFFSPQFRILQQVPLIRTNKMRWKKVLKM